ncbi:GNAT family N-acetyltransferase [Algoriphagus sp. H41]|uniref:GNAT family N-acetyltransferase n=1 Tax=Algoriphagus oliviformis TaxID=2811231 RepID=A0ABS3C217_9BACT|nr:GNAT family N-acetyltransferase [Algoriphagus oliviformis]MBN7811131.1 GNAT family N-acetyltransferase [Algoriphagus oliviformis]
MIELLDKSHDRSDFDCGNETLNNYLKYQAGQDVQRKLSVCFVLSDPKTRKVQGYYTLSNAGIPLHLFPSQIQKKLPKSYQSIPATLLGRLAIDLSRQGKGIGKTLLIDALRRSFGLSNEIGSFAVFVDPIDSAAEAFYEKYDFVKLPDSGKMFIPMKTLKDLFS